jgi:hypothetical protein
MQDAKTGCHFGCVCCVMRNVAQMGFLKQRLLPMHQMMALIILVLCIIWYGWFLLFAGGFAIGGLRQDLRELTIDRLTMMTLGLQEQVLLRAYADNMSK